MIRISKLLHQRLLQYLQTLDSEEAQLLLKDLDCQAQPTAHTTDLGTEEVLEINLLEQLYDHAPFGYHSLDKDGIFIRINDTELEMLGYSREEVLGQKFSDLITPESLLIFQQNFPIFKQRDWVKDLEFQMRCKDGTILPVSLSATAIKDEAGKYLMSRSVVIDISDRKQAEKGLREREQKLSLFVRYAPGSVAMFDQNMRYIAVSQRWVDVYNLGSIEALVGRSYYDIFPNTPKSLRQAHQQALAGVIKKCEEECFTLSDGSLQWLRWEIKPWWTNMVKVDGIIMFVEDISDFKQTETILEQQLIKEHLLAKITRSIHKTLDVDQVLHSAVEGVRNFLQIDRVIIFRFHPDWSGTAVAESIATGCNSILNSKIYDPCFGEKYVEPYRQGRVSMVCDFLTSDVEPCYQELMAQFQVRANLVIPILHKEQLWGLAIAHHCCAPREWKTEEVELLQQLATQLGIAIKQAELYQKNAEQASLIDIASDAIIVRDLSDKILFWSQGAHRLYGWKKDEAIGQIAEELFEEEFSPQLTIAQNKTIEQGNWRGELKQFTKEDQEIMVESRWTLIKNQQDSLPSILVVNTDITEKKQLEMQLLRTQRLESIGTLAGGIAHDLNNILTPILSFIELLPLKIRNLDESTLELLKLIEDTTLRGIDIVKQVVLFARGTEIEWTEVSISKLIKEVVNMIRETFPKSIVIKEYISPNLFNIQGDFTQLHQVLMNLCVNARDAMPDGGKLVISAENICVDEQYFCANSDLDIGYFILITVTDTGMGISPEIIDRIFDPFFTTKEVGKGTGIGLSTVMGIVKNHRGTIEVKSDSKNGTQFQIYLPSSESMATTGTRTDQILPFGQEELILLVDDEVLIRKVTKATLEKYNYRVITASDGLEAIAIYAQQAQEIKVVLMDLIMPEIDGLTTMRALKKINPSVKLIVTSGMTTKKYTTDAESIGIKAFLAKPYTAEKLLFNLNKVIANS